MAKLIDYPRATLQSSMQLAKAVDSFGGKCSPELAADKLGKKISGAFAAVIGSAVRFNLVQNKKGQLETTELYKQHKLAYSKSEADALLVAAFLSPGLFQNIYERFRGLELPLGHFEKVLIREFSVPEQISSRVAKYFLDGAKQCGLLGANNILAANASSPPAPSTPSDEDYLAPDSEEAELPDDQVTGVNRGNSGSSDEHNSNKIQAYFVHLKGPGMDSRIEIHEEEDLIIVEAMLKKIKRRLQSIEEE